MLPFIWLAIGLLLIFLEFFLPGGVMGTLGALAVVASIVIFALQTDSVALVILYTLGCVVLFILLFRFALWRIRHGEPSKTIYADDAQEGFIASQYDKSLIGKMGIVDTDLKPGGHIIVEEKRHPAISLSGYISKGEKVEVISGEGESLIVKKEN
ncbi:putative membrane-bound serine protease [Waddlia chondrophila 2032/99]|uniref:Putative membrane-bound serine protease n=1 Tax=Waddlia chondrophila 2032/99 TaxID=765953 RepID=F8LE14_9BACT|nr:putative membrane-bound serine protease [Waddlia chondrophila 2032/99]